MSAPASIDAILEARRELYVLAKGDPRLLLICRETTAKAVRVDVHMFRSGEPAWVSALISRACGYSLSRKTFGPPNRECLYVERCGRPDDEIARALVETVQERCCGNSVALTWEWA